MTKRLLKIGSISSLETYFTAVENRKYTENDIGISENVQYL